MSKLGRVKATKPFTGEIEELSIWSCFLTPEEIEFLYQGKIPRKDKLIHPRPPEPACICDIFNFGCTCQRLTWEKANG